MEEIKKDEFKIDVEEMAQLGIHFGHRTSKTHPKMEPYLFGKKNTVHLIDLEKTKDKLEKALQFIRQLVLEGKTLVFVGTKIQIKELLKNIALECGFPYVNERWLGGTFTNFEIIKKRIEYFKDLEKKKTKEEFEKYTKKERAEIEKELIVLDKKFGGIKNLEKLPEAIFVLDMKKDALSIKEAREKGIKVIGISDTNVDPNLADYPIPANDDAISSVKYILEKVREVILNAKLKAKNEKPQPKTQS
ncbi:MAG: 30S ribosomal protein S2 [Candidatus Nealsonbacteria bacterium]|nr:30S ribosomal protein S2 [Candidatus Nealsonbacteria bacterium]